MFSESDEELPDFVSLQKELHWIQAQIWQFQTLIFKLTDSPKNGAAGVSSLEENTVEELQKKLEDLKVLKIIKECKMKSLLFGKTLVDISFPTQEDCTTARNKTVLALTDKVKSLTAELCKLQKVNAGLEATAQHLEYDISEISKENSEFHAKLQQQKRTEDLQANGGDDADIRTSQANYRKIKDVLQLVESSLQAFIIGSGINWAKDRELTSVVNSFDKVHIENEH